MELNLRSLLIILEKDFRWSTTANISHNRNKILALGNEAQLLNQGERTELYLNKVGGPLIQFLVIKLTVFGYHRQISQPLDLQLVYQMH